MGRSVVSTASVVPTASVVARRSVLSGVDASAATTTLAVVVIDATVVIVADATVVVVVDGTVLLVVLGAVVVPTVVVVLARSDVLVGVAVLSAPVTVAGVVALARAVVPAWALVLAAPVVLELGSVVAIATAALVEGRGALELGAGAVCGDVSGASDALSPSVPSSSSPVRAIPAAMPAATRISAAAATIARRSQYRRRDTRRRAICCVIDSSPVGGSSGLRLTLAIASPVPRSSIEEKSSGGSSPLDADRPGESSPEGGPGGSVIQGIVTIRANTGQGCAGHTQPSMTGERGRGAG